MHYLTTCASVVGFFIPYSKAFLQNHYMHTSLLPATTTSLFLSGEMKSDDDHKIHILPNRVFAANDSFVPTIDLRINDVSDIIPNSILNSAASKLTIIKLEVAKENQKRWESMALALSESAKQEEGCISYIFAKIDDRSDAYQLVVHWESEEAEKRHFESSIFSQLAPQMTALCKTQDIITSKPLMQKKIERKKEGEVVIGQIELNRKMTLAFTCKKCETRNIYKITRVAYYEGVVLCTCSGCQSQHLIADNKGLLDFPEFGRNIEEYMASQGESVHRLVVSDSGIGFQDSTASETPSSGSDKDIAKEDV